MSSAELQEKLAQPLTVGRGAPEEGGQRKRGAYDESEDRPARKRHFSDNGRGGHRHQQRGQQQYRHHDGRRDGHQQSGGGYQRDQRRGGGGYHQQHENIYGPGVQRRGYRERHDQHQQEQRVVDKETRFKYKWTLSADNVRILTVTAFNTQLLTVSSNGNLVIDTSGYRSFHVFQALNMCLQPFGLKVIAADSVSIPEASNRLYKGGLWQIEHVKYKWKLDFQDNMKISAFPNRDWKKILPNLEALPESVVFSHEPATI
mmetsp:Transcript_7803/g.10886  ORF Transcript_7803/g.10886 Transcript_7803/m.10886 type:complete len:259 (+) Transcript_7803:27-803(+)